MEIYGIQFVPPQIKDLIGSHQLQTNVSTLFTYKRDAGSQQQDSDQQVFKLLNNQLPDALAWKKRSQIVGRPINLYVEQLKELHRCKIAACTTNFQVGAFIETGND